MDSQIKDIRTGLKLSSTEFGHRLGVTQSTALRLEQSEQKGSITIHSLRRAAHALGCRLEYKLVPNAVQRVNKSYHGLRRISRSHASKTSSVLGERLKQDERNAAAMMTAEQRIIRACELADFTKSLK